MRETDWNGSSLIPCSVLSVLHRSINYFPSGTLWFVIFGLSFLDLSVKISDPTPVGQSTQGFRNSEKQEIKVKDS